MTENDKQFIKNVINFKKKLTKLSSEIKEKYNVSLEYNSTDNVFNLKGEDNMNLVAAKKFINEVFGDSILVLY